MPLKDPEFQVYDNETFLKLMKAVTGTKDEIIISLAGLLGLRRGEIFGLRWQDVNFNNSTITIRQTLRPTNTGCIFKEPKSKKSSRTLVASDSVMRLLKKYRISHKEERLALDVPYFDNDLVFCRANDLPHHPSLYSKYFSDLLIKFNLPHIRFHDLRHFNATLMLSMNIPIKVASARLGHSTTQITQDIYQHVLIDMDRDVADKIETIFITK